MNATCAGSENYESTEKKTDGYRGIRGWGWGRGPQHQQEVVLEMRLEGPLRHANEGDRRFRSRFGNVRSFWGGQGLVETGLWEKIGHKLKVESQVLH